MKRGISAPPTAVGWIMRVALVLGVVLALTADAVAKYNPCRSTGEVWLAPPDRMPRNAKLWLARNELSGEAIRIRGPGVDRVVHQRKDEPFVDLGVLEGHAIYELTVERWGWRFARFETDDAPGPLATPR